MALELYAKQARNTDAERRASEVRLPAERRTGELLKELARGEPGRPEKVRSLGTIPELAPTASPYAEALATTGISTQTASRYQSTNLQTAFADALGEAAAKAQGALA